LLLGKEIMVQKALIGLNVLLTAAVITLFVLFFTKPKRCNTSMAEVKGEKTTLAKSGVIAYVDLDSLETHYTLFKEKKAELENRQKSFESTLTQKASAFQAELYELQQRAAMMTQAEGEAAQQRMYKKQAEIEEMRDRMANQFMDEQTAFNEQLQNKLDSFVATYNADGRYKFILSYKRGGNILYKSEAYNITEDVINGMNAQEIKKP
jgi:outer membrane protein